MACRARERGECVPAALVAKVAEFERRTGFEMGVCAVHDAGRAMLPDARETWQHPTFSELEKRRAYSDDPCSRRCGRCSACIRAENVAKNWARYGSADRPGRAA